MPADDTATWSENELAGLREEFGDAYRDRTCLVTGADGSAQKHEPSISSNPSCLARRLTAERQDLLLPS